MSQIKLNNNESVNLNKIIKKYKNDEQNEMEFEIRLLTKANKNAKNQKYISGIDESVYNNLKNYLDKNAQKVNVIKELKKTDKNNNIEIVEYKNHTSDKIQCIYYINKLQIEKMDVLDYNLRFSVSIEKQIDKNNFSNENVVYIKKRVRYEYILNDMYIHISTFKINEDVKTYYDCEIEMTNKELVSKIKILETVEKIICNGENIEFILSNYEKQYILSEYTKCINMKYCKFIGTQPHTLKQHKIDKNEKYALTYKLDGTRQLMYIAENGEGYYISNKLNIVKSNIVFHKMFAGTIFDGEYFENVYHIFDILYYKYDKIDHVDLHTRIYAINELLDMNNAIENIKLKEYYFSENIFAELTNMIKKIDMKKHDGIILCPINSCESLTLKWKPVELNTIDFKVKINKGIAYLYVYDEKEEVEFVYTDTNYNIQGKIVDIKVVDTLDNNCIYEMIFDMETQTFKPIRKRNDKIKGNYVKVAIDNLQSVLYPINLELLKRQEEKFYNMKRFHNWVKRIFLDKYCSNQNLIDIACGRGGDIQKWFDNGIRYVEGYDIDSESITEARKRFEQAKQMPVNKNFQFVFNQKDILKSKIEKNEKNEKYNMTSFFSMHYFLNDIDTFVENTITQKLNDGGYFLCTMMDKELLEEYLKKNITYPEFKIEKINNSIVNIHINDTIVKTERKEMMMESNEFLQEMRKNNLELVEEIKFKDLYKNWFKNRNNMETYELDLSFLNKMYVFKFINH